MLAGTICICMHIQCSGIDSMHYSIDAEAEDAACTSTTDVMDASVLLHEVD